MILPFNLDRIPQTIGRWLARRQSWDPVGRRVQLSVTDSGDAALLGKTILATIRATSRDDKGELALSLLDLDHDIAYEGHYARHGIKIVVTRPYLRWHDLNRLLVTFAVVRVVDAESFDRDQSQRIIAIASMRLIKD